MSEELPADSQGKMVVFGAKQIRRTWHEEQWFFSVVDIIAVLTDSHNPRNYWNMMKARVLKQSGIQLSTLCVQLKLTSADGFLKNKQAAQEGGSGRWAFLQIADPWDVQKVIRAPIALRTASHKTHQESNKCLPG